MTTARDLSRRLADLLRREHEAMADFLVALAEFDRSRGWEALGYSSLFYYLHRELGLSKGAAYYRKVAAEAVQRFPELIERLRDGSLCLTSVAELAKVLTPENLDEVLPRFLHLSRREAMEVAAEVKPAEAPRLRTVITPVLALPSPAASPLLEVHAKSPDLDGARRGSPVNLLDANSALYRRGLLPQAEADSAARTAPVSEPGPAPSRGTVIEPLTGELRRMHLTVTKSLLAKLAEAHDALSHAAPDATDSDVLESALDLLLAKRAKRKGIGATPRKPARPTTSPDHVPADVQRTVFARDEGRCQWPLDSGGVCGSTRRLELAHRVSRARGGPTTVENLRLLCRFHNQLEARRELGDAFVERCVRSRQDAQRRASPEPQAL